MINKDESLENALLKQIDKLNYNLTKGNLLDLSELIGSRKEIMKRNFIAGIFRGIGIGIGVTILTAILVLILRKIVTLNIPVIGEYISDIVDIVQKSR